MAEESKTEGVHFHPPVKLLVIDDSQLNRSFVENVFSPPNYEVVSAGDADEGIKLTFEEKPELILLDIMMPDKDGFAVADELKANPETKEIPIIFITALDAIQEKLRAFDTGAVDYVTKPFNHKELEARVRTNVELRRIISRNENMLRLMMEEKRHETIARIAAGISHNFNNMLGVIFGNIMLMESIIGRDLDPAARDALADSKVSLERMQAMVQQFLLLANQSNELKGGKPNPSRFPIKTLIENVVENIRLEKSSSAIPVTISGIEEINESHGVYCDRAHIREAFQVLINEVITTTFGKADCHIKVDSRNAEVIINVDVKGIHLPEGVEESIFEPFALPIANVGTGLSFSVARYLIEINDGRIGAGFPGIDHILFTITLPGEEIILPE